MSQKMTIYKKLGLKVVLTIGVIILSGTQALACSNPTASAGDMIYNTDHNVMQYCDGTDWTAMRASGGKFVDGTNAADAVYTSGDVGIGITDPEGPLHIRTVIDAGSNSPTDGASLIIGDYNAAHIQMDNNEIVMMADPTTNSQMSLQPDGGGFVINGNKGSTNEFRVDGDGNVGVGRVPDVSGKITIQNNVNNVIKTYSTVANGADLYMDADGLLAADGNIYFGIDGNNNETNRDFFFVKDTGVASTTNTLFRIEESGKASLGGTDLDGTFTITGAPDISSVNTAGQGGMVIQNVADDALGRKMRFDANEIQTSNAGAPSSLIINPFGGNLSLGTDGTPTGNIVMNEGRIVDLADPTSDQDAATKAYVDSTTGISGTKAVIRDQKASGTNGQTLTANTWVTRNLNNETDPSGVISISSNQFTPTVNGWVEWHAPGRDSFSTRLRNTSDGATVAKGTSIAIGGGYISQSTGMAPVIAGKSYSIQQMTNLSLPGGYASAPADGVEIYTQVFFTAD